MWLIFLVVVLVLALLMVFLLIAIRMLTVQAGQQLNRYFLKNLETYDRLAENKNKEISALQARADKLNGQIEKAELRLQNMAEATSMAGTAAATTATHAEGTSESSGAAYCDPDFLENYAYMRQKMKFDYHAILEKLLSGFDYSEDEAFAMYRGMLDKLPQSGLYNIVVMSDDDQLSYLHEIFDEKECACLDAYIEDRQGAFDVLAFRAELENYVKSEAREVYIRTGSPEELSDMERDHIHVLFDPGVHEGFRVSFKNTVYDYSL
jgi:hypothetical protein